jgi:hypothetical protein
MRCGLLARSCPRGATSEPAPSRTVPPPPETEPTPEEIEGLQAIIKEHGYELLV